MKNRNEKETPHARARWEQRCANLLDQFDKIAEDISRDDITMKEMNERLRATRKELKELRAEVNKMKGESQ